MGMSPTEILRHNVAERQFDRRVDRMLLKANEQAALGGEDSDTSWAAAQLLAHQAPEDLIGLITLGLQSLVSQAGMERDGGEIDKIILELVERVGDRS